MKYFLIASILCTISTAFAHDHDEHCGVNMGTLEIWSDWYSFNDDVNPGQVCAEIRDSYNSMNAERGFFGKLEYEAPVAHQFRPLNDDPKERRFSCRLRIKKFDID